MLVARAAFIGEVAVPQGRIDLNDGRAPGWDVPAVERPEMDPGADLQEVYDTERHLLYVACTRARDHLLVTGVNPASEFLDDFTKGYHGRAAVALG